MRYRFDLAQIEHLERGGNKIEKLLSLKITFFKITSKNWDPVASCSEEMLVALALDDCLEGGPMEPSLDPRLL